MQHLDGGLPTQLRVHRLINCAHAALAELARDAVAADLLPWLHGCLVYATQQGQARVFLDHLTDGKCQARRVSPKACSFALLRAASVVDVARCRDYFAAMRTLGQASVFSALSLSCVLVLGALGSACSTKSPSDELMDMTPPAPDLTFTAKSNCGHPGDKGNSLGVGKFCQRLLDCSDNVKAFLCTTIADPDNYFCTFRCKIDADCGEDANCQCAAGGCGCFPNACGGPPPADMSVSDARPATDGP